jgi:RsmE family RNA methyltransferase
LNASKIAERLERLERVADAAIKQSGAQSERLCITICNNLASALKLFHLENDVSFQESRLLMQTPRSLDRQAPTILQYFTIPPDSLRNDLKITDSSLQSTPKPAESYLVIGPEGGLSAHEETLASEQYHYLPVSLGPKTLRVETAVIAAGSIAGLAQMRK